MRSEKFSFFFGLNTGGRFTAMNLTAQQGSDRHASHAPQCLRKKNIINVAQRTRLIQGNETEYLFSREANASWIKQNPRQMHANYLEKVCAGVTARHFADTILLVSMSQCMKNSCVGVQALVCKSWLEKHSHTTKHRAQARTTIFSLK